MLNQTTEMSPPRPDLLAAPLSRRLFLIIWPLLAIVVLLLALAGFCMEVLSAARAYVGGESLWTKGQKDAVHHLLRYAQSGDEYDYRSYLTAIAIPLGDRKAREELEKPDADFKVAARGFIEARNDPADTAGMIRLYRWFRRVSYMREAIAIWVEADGYIEQLHNAGRRLHEQIASVHTDREEVGRILAEINRINMWLTPLEERFSYTLGKASRGIRDVLLRLMLVATAVLVLAGVMISRRTLQHSQKVEIALRNSEASLKEAQGMAHLGNWSYEPGSGAAEWSAEALRIFGLDPASPAPHHEQHLEMIHEEDRQRIVDLWDTALGRGRSYEAEYRILTKGTRLRWVHERGYPQHDNAGCVVRLNGTVMDITARKEAEDRIRYLAHYDDLTGLPNRNLFNQRLGHALAQAQRHGRPLALLFIDLDGFKVINDRLGHDAGDLVLKEVAGRLRGCLRESDTVARQGGDEFTVLIEDFSVPHYVALVARKILDAIARPLLIEGSEYYVTTSVGISTYPDGGGDMQTLRKNADRAMYRAKEQGKNKFEFYSAQTCTRA